LDLGFELVLAGLAGQHDYKGQAAPVDNAVYDGTGYIYLVSS
jgi:hypothetical protein